MDTVRIIEADDRPKTSWLSCSKREVGFAALIVALLVVVAVLGTLIAIRNKSGPAGCVGFTRLYCDLTTDGGNWIVFQRRKDGSESFDRNWNDYVTGFGNPEGEYWLGLEALHQLTKVGCHELRIDLVENRTGSYYYAKYSSFQVGHASDNYRLSVGLYSGNASDSFRYQDNQQFSTKDADHDEAKGNCAATWKGAWWYGNCYHSHLNGIYNATDERGIVWWDQDIPERMWMKVTEMKFRIRS